jgi:hypothetical protein
MAFEPFGAIAHLKSYTAESMSRLPRFVGNEESNGEVEINART